MPGGAGSALLLALSLSFHLSPAAPDQCSKGSNVFTELPENSANGTAVATLALPAAGSVKLCLSGADATWFYLDGRTVRLQAAPGAPLDREALESPVLMVALTCSEDGFSPVEYRLVVQVLNENDNRPRFQPGPELTHNVSELVAVNSVVFTTQAEDGDGDTLVYVIDGASADAKHFRIDLPNSGRIVLAKALDFETRRQLDFVVHAVEMNTKERYKASAHIHVNVLDGDDQYPQFLPCRALLPATASVCLSPIYTANITAGRAQVRPLHFLPGAIHAEDGDHGLKAAITYSLLPGPYSGWFHVNNATGAVTLLRPLDGPGLPPAVTLQVMAAQVNDATKFAVAEARVRVLAPNRHPPRFAHPRYPAFVRQGPRTATLATTYGGRVLALHAADRDFPDGFNPWIRYRLALPANASELFQLMPNGLLVARADQLQPSQHFLLQVIARDEESGEVTNTTVDIEVLRPGQAAPQDPVEAGQEQSPPDVAVITRMSPWTGHP
ncbi:protocadherin Fat 1-like [Alligator mississippiensis]|uniref:Protocadherin Fat 1-like n=1 Tax=Alligator mississippiensis TaxID=8496 RepID=A0A151MPM2_ALLMI|nr:protocadherin Fat 1-like [Alligator mississippiensis]